MTPDHDRPAGGARFDLLMLLPLLWVLSGAYLDAWAHNHFGNDLDTFFTPWHAVLYSGFLAVVISMIVAAWRGHSGGYGWLKSVPAGYGLSLVGVALFGVGGVGDLIWHTLFGVEVDVDAALSPTHLLLQVAIVLLVAGPLRAAWNRADERDAGGWRGYGVVALGLALTLSSLTLISQIIHPLVQLWPTQDFAPSTPDEKFTHTILGVVGILVHSAILMGIVLLGLRCWWGKLPFGTFTLTLTLDAVYLSLMRDQYRLIPSMVVAGLAADLVARWAGAVQPRGWAVRALGFAVPALLYGGYFLTLRLTDTLWWTVHAVIGSVAIAGLAGLMVSLLAFPPSIPGESPAGPISGRR